MTAWGFFAWRSWALKGSRERGMSLAQTGAKALGCRERSLGPLPSAHGDNCWVTEHPQGSFSLSLHNQMN